MRFSWSILNSFINLDKINLTDFIEKLNLAGLEVEEIKKENDLLIKHINLNITANRKEICCVINLGIEISSIFNIPLKMKLKPFKKQNLYKNTIKNYTFQKNDRIAYVKVQTIYLIEEGKTPQWLKQILGSYNINNELLLYNIQEYIKIKWGHRFHFIQEKVLKKNLSKHKHDQLIYNLYNKNLKDYDYLIDKYDYNYNNKIIIYWPITNTINNIEDTFANAYEEAIQLIASYQKSIIGKSSEYYNINYKNYSNTLKKIYSKNIKYLLGKTKNHTFLSNKELIQILHQLNLKPKYSLRHKEFTVEIPLYRKHDLERNIDIIEEIGRIYGFKNFLNKLPISESFGNISSKYFYTQRIRYILRIMGIYEIITPSLNKVKIPSPHNLLLYNPITEDQNKLRENIIHNLIYNYKSNTKLDNINNNFFEIGQIFYETPESIKEETHLGLLMQSNNFIKENWSGGENSLNWSNAKGIIENLFTMLDTQVKWNRKIVTDIQSKYINNYFHSNNYILLFDSLQNNLIGIFGEINYKLFNIKDKQKTYLMEINIGKLVKTIKNRKHLNYTNKQYSYYPNVSRDISIKICKDVEIKNIKHSILQQYIELIESVYIISDYHDKLNNERAICLRLNYRSIYRTLNKQDLNKIDQNIINIVKLINNFSKQI